MNQDTEWYGDRPPKEQSISADHLTEQQREELQHRLGLEPRSQSDKNLLAPSIRSTVYHRGRYNDPWCTPNWQHRTFASQLASSARMEDAHSSRRTSVHNSDRPSDREDPRAPSIVPNSLPLYQRGYFTSRDLMDRPTASSSSPSIAKDQREAQSLGERIGTGSPLDSMVYNPQMPPPLLDLPPFDPTQPPPSLKPAARQHERNIFDALPPLPPPPTFEFDMNQEGDIVVQPLQPQIQVINQCFF